MVRSLSPPPPASLARFASLVLGTSLVLVACRGSSNSTDNGSAVPKGTPPIAPTQLAATPAAAGIALAWEDNSRDETAFAIERSENGGAFAELGLSSTDAPRFVDTQPQADTRYAYRVRARNAHGDSAPSNSVAVQTPPLTTRGCGLVISGEFDRSSTEWDSAAPTSFSMWAHRRGYETVVARGSTPAGQGSIRLDGGAAGTVWIEASRRIDGDRTDFALGLRFSRLTRAEHRQRAEFSLSLHRARLGDYATFGVRASSRTRFVAALSATIELAVVPERIYAVKIAVNRARGTYSVSVDGVPLAHNVPIDAVFVTPVIYLHDR